MSSRKTKTLKIKLDKQRKIIRTPMWVITKTKNKSLNKPKRNWRKSQLRKKI